ncbi:MAG: metallophosphoesterase family protein [Acidimicrobiales bacterium]|jgi:exonuclease SbcD
MVRTSAPGDFCFVHAADLHLDTPFKGVSETAPHVGAALREASLEAFDQLVQLCIDRRAAFLVVAGDVYDGAERGLRAQLRFRAGLQRLSDEGIETFVVHGNHDPVEEGWSAVGVWPQNVHFFAEKDVGCVAVERGGSVIARVQGISYGQREVRENLALRFSRRPGEGLQIGLLHCNVAGAPDGHASYSPCTLTELKAVGLDYWALGHVHARTVMAGEPYGGEPFVVYPGNLQARSPKPSERGPKGATVVEVRGGRVARVEAVACDVVRFTEIGVDVDGCGAVADVRSALGERASEELESSAGRSLVVQARLTGRGAVHCELARDGVRAELLSALREDWDGSEPFVWWDQIADDTRGVIDLDRAREAGDFVGDLLATAQDLGGGAGSPLLPMPASASLGEDFLEELLGKMPSELRARAMELLGGDLSAGELIEAASALALDHLEVA